jgi:hypothetical protein
MLDGGSLSATGGTDASEDGYIDGLADCFSSSYFQST